MITYLAARRAGGVAVSQGTRTQPADANDHPKYVKHVLGRIYVFFTLFGCSARRGGWRSPKGLVHNLLMQFFTPGSSTIEVLETFFFDTVIT